MSREARIDGAWAFAQVDDFWQYYRPLTPWGKDEAAARRVLADRQALEERYDAIGRALAFIESRAGETATLERVSYHLKRMPRLPLEEKPAYELLELFQIKKFIANYRGVASALDAETSAAFGLRPFGADSAAQALASELDRGGSDPETFYLADSYDPGLAEARAGVAAADAAIGAERVKAEAKARLGFGVSFDGRDFLLVPRETAKAMMEGREEGCRFSAEPYDDTRFMVRILPSPAAVDALSEREGRLEAERACEERVVARLSVLAARAMPELREAVAATTRWDLARAGAELAVEYRMSRPRLGSQELRLREARFVPCEAECARMGLAYSPLSTDFSSSAIVLFGSNMGGKTVVLKTVLFFQLLAQAGLYVPAGSFATRVYDRVEYVGELEGERHAGLSGFGLEVWRLGAAWTGGREPGVAALVAFDELARTTGSHEAEALLSAVVEAYASGANGGRAFFATHFRGVARVTKAEYRRMRGLDRERAAAAIVDGNESTSEAKGAASGGARLERRLADINRYMRYEVVEDDGSSAESDALAIAALLGLEAGIVERARYYLAKDGI